MPKTKKNVFTEEDYNSNDGFLTSIWGNSAWHLLHTISFNYPVNPRPKDKENYRNFILSLKNVLPCGKCRANLKENFKKLPYEWLIWRIAKLFQNICLICTS